MTSLVMSSAVCLFILHHPEKEKGFLVGTKSSGPVASSIIRSPSLDRVLWHAVVPDADADACVPARRFPGVSLLRYSSGSCMTSHNPAAGVASTKHPVAPLVPAWGGLRRHASLIPCQSAGPTVWDIQASSVQCIIACVVLRAAGVGAGHGSQVPDQSGDETDGLNETLCPCDFKHVRIPLLPCCPVPLAVSSPAHWSLLQPCVSSRRLCDHSLVITSDACCEGTVSPAVHTRLCTAVRPVRAMQVPRSA